MQFESYKNAKIVFYQRAKIRYVYMVKMLINDADEDE